MSNKKSQNSKLKVGIIGLGKIGFTYKNDAKRTEISSHCEAVSKNTHLELTAAADSNLQVIKSARTHLKETNLYNSANEMLQKETLDVLVIASPTTNHIEHLELALQNNLKAIVCEKPLTISSRDLKRIEPKLKKNKPPVVINFSRRWDKMLHKLQHNIRKGTFGITQTVDAYYTGSLLNNGSHIIDLSRMLFGEPKAVVALPPYSKSIDDGINGVIEFSNNMLLHLHAMPSENYLLFELDCYTSNGRFRLCDSGFELKLWKTSKHQKFSNFKQLKEKPNIYGRGYDNLLTRMYEHLIRVVTKSEIPLCGFKDGIEVLLIQEALVASSCSKGKWIKL